MPYLITLIASMGGSLRATSLRVLAVGMLTSAIAACAVDGAKRPATQSLAAAMWTERCKKAGVFIHRQVDNVEGIALLNLRTGGLNYGDQFAMDDPYGRDLQNEGYIMSFLHGFWPKVEKPTPLTFTYQGYRYVEAVDPQDGRRYRFTGEMRDVERVATSMSGNAAGRHFVSREFVLIRIPAPGAGPRYGVSFEDISTPEERQHWIAGSSLKVIDLETKEVIAERIGYMVDPGQGSKSGGRSPWLLAASYSCPRFRGDGSSDQRGQTARFVEQVLHPTKGE